MNRIEIHGDVLTITSQARELADSQLTLNQIQKVTFFKLDRLTTDMICCELAFCTERGDTTVVVDEDFEGWENLQTFLMQLPGFDKDWFIKVVQPAFETCWTVAYVKHGSA